MKRKLQFVFALLAMVVIATMFTTATAGPPDRVVICHQNMDELPVSWVTIEVSANSVDQHIAQHEDYLGACVQ